MQRRNKVKDEGFERSLVQNKNVIIIHGAYGHPEENWFGWFKNQMQLDNIDCHVPHFPTPEGQNLPAWLEIFNKSYKQFIHSNTILIGHSLGALFVLRWLEQHNCQLPTVILVGAFLNEVGIEKFDRINYSFLHPALNWKNIKPKSTQFICYQGDNDPYIPQDQLDIICDQLDATKIIIPQGGHLNTAAGFTSFPQLLLDVKKIQELNNA